MGYVSSSAALPPNSAVAGPPVIDTAAVDAIFNASRTGRERVYANCPTAASLWDLGSGLAVDASQILGQSEQSRQAVLIGLAPAESALSAEPTLAEILASAPVVSSLNGSPGDVGGASPESGVMPAPAPHMTYGGLWASAKLPGGRTGAGQLGVTTVVTTRPSKRNIKPTPNLGPGCTLPYTRFGGAPRPGAPPWGDASLAWEPGPAGAGVSGWWWLIAAGVGVALLAKKRGRR